MAFRLSLTLAGSYSVSAAWVAELLHAIVMASNAIPNKCRIDTSALVLSNSLLQWSWVILYFSNRLVQLTEPPLRVSRTELGGLLIPNPRRRLIGRDAPQILAAQHLRIIGPRQHQRGFRLLRVRGPFEQQSGGSDVADRKQALRALQQRHKLVRIDASYRSRLTRHRNGLTNGRSDRDDRGRRCYRSDLTGGFASHRLGYRDLALERALIGGGDFVARRRC